MCDQVGERPVRRSITIAYRDKRTDYTQRNRDGTAIHKIQYSYAIHARIPENSDAVMMLNLTTQ